MSIISGHALSPSAPKISAVRVGSAVARCWARARAPSGLCAASSRTSPIVSSRPGQRAVAMPFAHDSSEAPRRRPSTNAIPALSR